MRTGAEPQPAASWASGRPHVLEQVAMQRRSSRRLMLLSLLVRAPPAACVRTCTTCLPPASSTCVCVDAMLLNTRAHES